MISDFDYKNWHVVFNVYNSRGSNYKTNNLNFMYVTVDIAVLSRSYQRD